MRITYHVGRHVSCELIVDAFVPQTLLKLVSVEEGVGKETPDICQYCNDDCDPPGTSCTGKALGELVVKGQE